MNSEKNLMKNIPVIGIPPVQAYLFGGKLAFPGTPAYWEDSHNRGGNSGAGSILSQFKAGIVKLEGGCK